MSRSGRSGQSLPNHAECSLSLPMRHRGGKRRGAGCKPKGPRPLVSHKTRPRFDKPSAVHVTLRVATHVWNLRSRRCFQRIELAIADTRERLACASSSSRSWETISTCSSRRPHESLSRGMQGLGVRIAKALNKLMQQHGSVFADHYHSRLLRTSDGAGERARVRARELREPLRWETGCGS